MILTPEDFNSNDTVELAHNLVGKYLVRQFDNNNIVKYMITEVEAYHGFEDKASHAYNKINPNKQTSRNQIMFGTSGRCYVYLCYGIHWLFNIITGEVGFPAAILIRGVNNIYGPGKVTKILQIDKSFNGRTLSKESSLWVEDADVKITNIIALPRVGINYAEEYKDKLWRFRTSFSNII